MKSFHEARRQLRIVVISFGLYSEDFERWTEVGKRDTVRDAIGSRARFAKLYLRSRRASLAVAVLSVAALLALLGEHLLLTSSYEIPGKVIKEIFTAATLLVPLVAACAIGLSARSSFGEEEETASRSLPMVRFCHLGGLLAFGVLMLCLVAFDWRLEHAGWVLARNLSGFAGFALLTARALGSSLSWVGPFAYGTLAVMVKVLNDDPPTGEWSRWAWWPLQPVTDAFPAAFALTLLVLGLLSVCLYRVRS